MSASGSNGAGNMPDPADLARKVAAQAVYTRQLPKRFYKQVRVEDTGAGWKLLLDERSVKTPSKQQLIVPTQPMGTAVAEEWEAQAEHVDPQAMPFTCLANTAIDRVEPERARIIEEMLSFANSDLLCYRAEQPAELIARQAACWDPVLDWFSAELGGKMKVFAGVVHNEQDAAVLQSFRKALDSFSSFSLTGMHNIMTMTGSAVLAFAAAKSHEGPDAIWSAAHVDEDWQIERWGGDEEEQARRTLRHAEFSKTVEFLRFC